MERRGSDAAPLLDASGMFAALGYAIEPLEIDADQWRRAGIAVPHDASLTLLLRQGHVDFLLVRGASVEMPDVTRFAETLRERNVLSVNVIAVETSTSGQIALVCLGRDGKSRTIRADVRDRGAISRLEVLASPGDDGDLERVIDRAFDREVLTSRFFVCFRRAVYSAASEIAGQFPNEAPDAVAAEALLMLSRLLFIYFIQEKGWLDGNRAFVSKSLDRTTARKHDFYDHVLEPLFFGCLNTPVAEREGASVNLGEIPYLNGGLFEPSPFETRNPRLHLSDDCCRFAIEEVFERFPFSINEREEEGLHVDPEMLGKVFESLMAEDERAATGSFYTPKAIVESLTRRSILAWLAAEDEELVATLERVLADEERAIESQAALPLLLRLQSVTVLDPACGSGAFLLAALNLIESLTVRLSAIAAVPIPSDLRQRIVETSLFGVDLKREAVRLCELRLWLAIVSPQELAVRDVRPLPNLDRNVLQGNSLLSPMDFLGSSSLDVYRSWLEALRAQSALISRYRHAPRAERHGLFRQIRTNDERLAADLLERAIERDEAEMARLLAPEPDLFGGSHSTSVVRLFDLGRRTREARRELQRVTSGEIDFFAFDVHFADVLAAGGFDIVLGNPPWVRMSRITPDARLRYRDRYSFFSGRNGNSSGASSAGFNQPDVAVAFVEKALSLARPGGVVAMLLPSKVATSAYGAVMRAAIERESVVAVEDWSGEATRWFDADTFPLGVTIRKSAVPRAQVSLRVDGMTYAVKQSALTRNTRGAPWSLIPPDCAEIVARLDRELAPLARTLGRRPIMGVKTGRNASFFLEIERRNRKLVDVRSGAVVPAAALCRCIRGRDIRAWTILRSSWMLWPPREGWSSPPRWLEQVAEVRGLDPADCRLAFRRPEHAGIKVVWKDLSRRFAAAVVPPLERIEGDDFCLVPNQTLYCLSAETEDEAHVLAAIFNSAIFAALALSRADRAKDRHYRYFGRTVAAVPLPSVKRGTAEWLLLGELSQRAHRGEDVSDEIDDAAAALYGLATADLRTLRAFVRQRLGM
jgi:hypothetical protein